MDPYTTVFVVTEKGFDWWFSAVGLGFVLLGAVLIKVAKARRWQGMQRWTGHYMVWFAALWTLAAFTSTFKHFYDAHTAYKTGQYSVVEGNVENFRPMPYSGHQDECFSVREHEFCYSDYEISAGFNQTASHGGPIRAGLPVRIAYRNQEIRRIDIRRDFVPTLQDRRATSEAARRRWAEWQQHDAQLDSMTLGFIMATVFLTGWWNISWRRFMRFWLKPPYRRTTEIGFRIFFAADLIGALWYLVSNLMRGQRQSHAYLGAIRIGVIWIAVFALMVHFAEWQSRRAQA